MTLPIDAAPVADLDHEDHRQVVLDDENHAVPPQPGGSRAGDRGPPSGMEAH